MPLTCLIVEDEPLAAEVLTDYISQVPFLELVSHCTDALRALDVLRRQRVDVIFLDLNLPGLGGFDLIKTLPFKPQVIITTAYHQHAIDGYEWDVVDYLLKPIEFSRFLSSVNRLTDPASPAKRAGVPVQQYHPYIFVYSDKKQIKVPLDEVVYVESERDYLRIVLRDKTIITRQTMQEFEKMMPPNYILRIHRSFLVRKEAIMAFDSSHIEVAGKAIPIGRQYRDVVLAELKALGSKL